MFMFSVNITVCLLFLQVFTSFKSPPHGKQATSLSSGWPITCLSNPPQVGWGWYGIDLHHFLESGVLDALNSLSYNGKGGRSQYCIWWLQYAHSNPIATVKSSCSQHPYTCMVGTHVHIGDTCNSLCQPVIPDSCKLAYHVCTCIAMATYQ